MLAKDKLHLPQINDIMLIDNTDISTLKHLIIIMIYN